MWGRARMRVPNWKSASARCTDGPTAFAGVHHMLDGYDTWAAHYMCLDLLEHAAAVLASCFGMRSTGLVKQTANSVAALRAANLTAGFFRFACVWQAD